MLRFRLTGRLRLLVGGDLHRVTAEQAGQGELTQLVAHHVLADVDRHELVSVVDRDRVPHELRRDLRASRPRLEHPLLVGRVEQADLHEERLLDERALLYAPWHTVLIVSPSPACAPGRSTWCSPSCDRASCGLPACPRATWAAGRPTTCLHHHPAGDPPGSSPPRAPSAGARASGSAPPSRSAPARAPRCPPPRWWPCTRPAPCALRHSAA